MNKTKKRSFGKRGLSFVLSFTLILSFFAGIGIVPIGGKESKAATVAGTAIANGAIVKDSAQVEWIVISQSGGQMLLNTKNCVSTSQFHGSSNTYSSSTLKSAIDSWGNTSAGADIRAIASTTYSGNGSPSVSGYKFFALSKEEAQAGYYATQANRVKNVNGAGSAVYWWLRSPSESYTNYAYNVYAGGGINYNGVYYVFGVAPACSLPSTTRFYQDGGVYRIAGQHKINYDANGGSVTPSYKTVYETDTYGELAVPTRSGWTFMGWSTDASDDCYNPAHLVSASTVMGTGDITVHAVWKPFEYQTVNGEKVLITAAQDTPDYAKIDVDTDRIAPKAFDDTTEAIANSQYMALKHITIPYNVKNIEKRTFANISTTNRPLEIVFKNPATTIEKGAFNPDMQDVKFTCYKDSAAAKYGKMVNAYGGTWCTVVEKNTIAEEDVTGELTKALTLNNEVSIIGRDAFKGHTELKNVKMNGVTTISESAFQASGITGTLILPDGLTTIGEKAFRNCSGITGTLVIPASVETIGSEAFTGTNIEAVVVLNPDSSKLSEFRSAFTGLSSLQTEGYNSVARYGFEEGEEVLSTANLVAKDAEYAGANYVVVGPYVTEIAENGFKDNADIKFVELSGATSLTKIGAHAFSGSSIPALEIPESVAEIGDGAFAGTDITSVILPASVETLGTGVFEGCENLISADLGNITDVPDDTFKGCTALTEIAGSRDFTTIGSSAFEGTAITNMVTSNKLTSVGDNAFSGCDDLENITIENPNVSIADAGIPVSTTVTAVLGSTANNDAVASGNPRETIKDDNGSELSMITITLDPNGGTTSQTEVKAVSGSKGSDLPAVKTPTKANQVFTGYYASNNKKWYDDKGQPVDSDANTVTAAMTLSARWANYGVTLAFNGNGGTGNIDNINSFVETATNLPSTGFTKTGKKLIGWCKDPYGVGDVYTSSYTPSMDEKNSTVTFYAVWQDGKVNFTFYRNGGTGTMADREVAISSNIALPTNGFTAPAGKVFRGWSLTSNAQNGIITHYDAVSEANEDGDTVAIYAIWEDEPVISQPTTQPTQQPSQPTPPPSQATQRPSSAPTNEPSGNTPGGSTGGDTPSNTPGGSSEPSPSVSASPTPTVSPSASPSATPTLVPGAALAVVRYDLNGGSASPAPADVTVSATKDTESGVKTGDVTITDIVPTKSGQKFLGWALTKESTVATYLSKTTYPFYAGTTTLYAVYADPASISYNFLLQKMMFDATGTVKYDSIICTTASAENTIKTLTANTYTEANGIKMLVTKGDFDIDDGYEINTTMSKLGPITITQAISGTSAGLVVLDRVKKDLVYDKNCTDNVTGLPDKVTDYWGKEVTLSTNKPVRAGYEFTGWAVSASATGLVTKAKIEKTGTTVYAQWKQASEEEPEDITSTTKVVFADDLSYIDLTFADGMIERVFMKDVGVTLEKGQTVDIIFTSTTHSGKKYKITVTAPNGQDETGDTVVKNGVTYKAGKKGATVTKIANKGSIKILDTVKIGSKTYKVTAIAKNAGKKLEKLAKLTVGKNITSIGASAFDGAAKLKNIILKTVKTKIGKNAFRKIYKKATFKLSGNKKQKKAMKKAIQKASTGYKKTMKLRY